VEQRTDETARRPGVTADDAGPPPAEDRPTETEGASEDAGKASGYSPEGESVWKPAPKSDSAYPADSAYAGPSADDGYRPSGTDREYSAPSTTAHDFPSAAVGARGYAAQPSESIYGASGTQHDFSAPPYPSQVTSAPRTQAETETRPQSVVRNEPDVRPQSEPRPQREADRPERSSSWQAAAARLPKPQPIPKRPKVQRPPKERTPKERTPKGGAQTRQAHLMVSRFEPGSVMKFSFIISLACFVILFVAVTLLYGTLAGLGVFDSIQKALSNVTSGQGTAGVSVSHWFSASTVLSYTALLGVLNVFLITAFATVGSVVYNLVAHLVGGVEVTLRETE
jgi:Transmembrane domain of unknown function (DUF3566)